MNRISKTGITQSTGYQAWIQFLQKEAGILIVFLSELGDRSNEKQNELMHEFEGFLCEQGMLQKNEGIITGGPGVEITVFPIGA